MRSCTAPMSDARWEWTPDLRCRVWGRDAPLFPGASASFAPQIIAAAGLALPFAVVHDDFAAGHNRARIALHLKAFEHGVIDTHVVRLRADGVERVRIPDDDIGIAARRDLALLRIHAKDTRGRR